jgi:UDPglucose--hexose-1-phosphate uridylyltransferase
MTKFSFAQNKSSVPELRLDPLTGLQVIVAPERLERPGAIRPVTQNEDDPRSCPFCPGNETATPNPVRVYPLAGNRLDAHVSNPQGAWQVRVIPNRYPAVRMETSSERADVESENAKHAIDIGGAGPGGPTQVLCPVVPGRGHHEVVVETPQHAASLEHWTSSAVASVWRAYRDRFLDWRDEHRLQCAIAFKNHGFEAGASLSHPHSQLIALDFVPNAIRDEIIRGGDYRRANHCCLVCSIVRQEVDSPRHVASKNGFVAWCPHASGVPYETWIAPWDHASHFECAGDVQIDALAEILVDVYRRLDKTIPSVAFNLVLQTSPFHMLPHEDYHWHLRIIPRLVRKAGFEWYSGCQINPVSPEFAADTLRQS